MGEIERPTGPHRSQIVQLVHREKDSEEPIFHYPMTVIDAVKTVDGVDLNQVLQDKLKELGQGVIDEVDKRVTVAVNSQLSSYEASIAYLSANYLRGIIKLPLSNLAKFKERKYYYLDTSEFFKEHVGEDPMPEYNPDDHIPAEDLVDGTLYALTSDRAKIYQRLSGKWELLDQNDRIILYGLLVPEYVDPSRRYISVTSGSGLPDKSLLESKKGDLYFDTATDIPYICLGLTWISALQSQAGESGSVSVLSPLIDLVSCRYITISSSGSGHVNYDLSTNSVSIPGSSGAIDDSLKDFVVALFQENLAARSDYQLYYCPKRPTEARYGDLWIDQRNPSVLYRNMSFDSNQVSWSPSSTVSSDVNLILDNLISGSDKYDAYSDHTWVNVLSGNPPATSIHSTVSGHGVQALVGDNISISKIVDVKPDTWYTYSCKIRPVSVGALPTINFVAEGCYIASTSHESGLPLSLQNTDEDGYVTYWMLVGTESNTTKSIMCITSSGGDGSLVHSVCLRQGSQKSWTASLADVVSAIVPVFRSISATSIIYRDDSSGAPSDNDLQILSQGAVVNTAIKGSWVAIDSVSAELSAAINELYAPYADSGTTMVFTQHEIPESATSDDGDIWVKDDLSIVRKSGDSWINSSSLLAGIQRTISTHVQKSTDVIMRNLFLDTSINPSDVFDLASFADPTVNYYQQADKPTSAKTGDIWFDTATNTIYRFNGIEWVVFGPSQLSDITQTVQGFESDVAAIYEDGSGSNLLNNSESINISGNYDLYTSLDFNSKYILSTEGSASPDTAPVYYSLRVTDQDGNGSYNTALASTESTFIVGLSTNLWRIITPKKDDVNTWVTSLKLRVLSSNQITLRKVKLARGQIYSPWDSSNADKESATDGKIDDLSDRLSNAENSTNDTMNSLSSTNAQMNSISADLANAINIANTALSQSVVVQQSASSLAIEAASTVRRVADAESVLETYASVFDFTSVGLRISRKVNGQPQAVSTYYRSNGLYIYDETTASDIAYFTNEGMKIINGEIENQLKIGNFLFVPRSGGGMSLVYAG